MSTAPQNWQSNPQPQQNDASNSNLLHPKQSNIIKKPSLLNNNKARTYSSSLSDSSMTVFSRHESISSHNSISPLSTDTKHNTISNTGNNKRALTEIDDDTTNISTNDLSKSPGKKSRTSHNKIEKKYRTNINTKFIELKDAVPTLRVLDNNEINFDELEGLAPASRLNKANILSKATEYIKHLESKNNLLLNEIRLLRANPDYVYQPPNKLHNMPIEVISNLPNQPQMSHIVIPQNDSNTNSTTYQPLYPYDNSNTSNSIPLPTHAPSSNNIPTNSAQPPNHTLSNSPSTNQQVDSSPTSQAKPFPRTSNGNITNTPTNTQIGPYFPHQEVTYTPNNFNQRSEKSHSTSVYRENTTLDRRNTYAYRSSTSHDNLDSPPGAFNQHQHQHQQQQHYQYTSNTIPLPHQQQQQQPQPPHDYYTSYVPQQIPNSRPPYYSQDGYGQNVVTNSTSNPNNLNTTANNTTANGINNQQQQPQQYEPANGQLARKIMIAGVSTLVGSNLVNGGGQAYSNSNDTEFYSLNVAPLLFFFNSSIKLVQFITLLSCCYYFIQPIIMGVINWKKSSKKNDITFRSVYLSFFIGFINLLLNNKPTTEIPQPENNIIQLDLTSFPTSLFNIFVTYIGTFNDSTNLSNPVEYTFNKIILLDLINKRSPCIGYMLGVNMKIRSLINSLLVSSKNNIVESTNSSSILTFIKCDPNFVNSKSVIDQLDKILISLNKTKSSKLTANELYGNRNENSGRGYNSVYEYLINTPTTKLNLYELVAVLWSVGNIRSRLVNFLNDIVNEDEKLNQNIEIDIKKLILEIQKIETFIPPPCIKLIKCCKIFKSLLDPQNETYLNDALKMILLSVEENLISIKQQQNDDNNDMCDSLLLQLHSSKPVLAKVLKIIHNTTTVKNIQLLSDENRLSLLCSIILHQYAIGNYNYGRSLIKYLKGGRSRKFMCSDSISLMASIATFRTLVVVLDTEKRIKAEKDSIEKNEEENDDDDDDDDLKSEVIADVEEDNYDTTSSSESEYEANDGLNNVFTFTNPFFNKKNNMLMMSYSKGQSLDNNDHHILEDLLCGLRLYVGQGKNKALSSTIITKRAESLSSNPSSLSSVESTDYDILSLHYGLQSELSHRLLELAKELVGYSE